MTRFGALVLRGGCDAIDHLASHGFQQQDIKVMLGASGGRSGLC